MKKQAILIADDRPENLRVLIERLQSAGLDREVISAQNGAVAYDLAHASSPALILATRRMPEVDGPELVRSLKTNAETADIPVIMIMAVETSSAEQQEALEAGSHDLLSEPYSQVELISRVRSTLRLSEERRRGRDRTASLDRMRHELEQFAYIVSHDLRAPLRAISTLVDIVEADYSLLSEEELVELLAELRVRSKRMDDLILGILAYSRAGRIDTAIRTFDLGQLAREVLQDLDPPAGFQLRLPDPNPGLTCSYLPLKQILTQVIGNALKHHHAATGSIALEFESLDDGARGRFAVTDDGPGIAMKYHGKVFEVFETANEESRLENTGVGLAIVKKLVEQLGGEVGLVSEPGAGSTFSFVLPIAAG